MWLMGNGLDEEGGDQMTTEAMCECGHNRVQHAAQPDVDNGVRDWKQAVCLTQFYRQPTRCECREYRAA